nr:mannosyltransferase family protein [Tessaracoccus coleopterorum]
MIVTDTVKPHLDWNIWLQWDAHHYIEIAENGYGPDVVAGNAPAFFPLFPLALRALMAIGIAPVHAGLLISAVATFVACAYLYRLAQLHGLDGDRAIIYLLLFPTGVFLTAGYTEALFLAGAIPAFYYAQRGRPWEAALFTAIAVGSRTVGLFVLLGVAIELARRAWPSVRGMISAVAAMVAASLPFWAYGLFLLRERGSFWAFMEVQRTGWGRDFVGFTDSLLATWRTWEGDYSANVIFSWRLEIVFAALSLGLLIWVMWRGYVGYAIYIGATLLIGLSNAWYYSTPRLALAFFPFAFLLAALVGRRERAHAMTVTAMTVLATVGLVAYTRGAWFF